MADSYEVDAEATEALRRQVASTLRFMTLSTVIGVVIIAILAAVLSDIRGVLILVLIVYVVTSIVAQMYLRRTFAARLEHGVPVAPPDPE
jgi:ABC-type xylose transport system permease subunit